MLALLLGTLLAAMRVSPVPTLRAAGATYVEIVRNTPLTLVFFFAVFVLPQLDIRLSFFVFAVIAVTVYHAAFFCEAVRSGINAVGVGQAEAARSIGLTFTQSLRLVVLPQAFRTVIPPLINVVIALTKNTSIAAAFGVAELTAVTTRLANANSDAVIADLRRRRHRLPGPDPALGVAGRPARAPGDGGPMSTAGAPDTVGRR